MAHSAISLEIVHCQLL